MNKLALIAGPTASGKSDLAVRLALALQESGKQAEIINADSAQVYNDLRVLSARPFVREMQGVVHKLFGMWDGAEACSAAGWAHAAKIAIGCAHENGVVPIVVGGTGLYIRTLLEGIAPLPPIHDFVREQVRAMDAAALRAALLEEDPVAAEKLKPNDSQRMARALEVIRSTGTPLNVWQQRKTGGIGDEVDLVSLVLLPDRDELYRRCDQRFAHMMENGAIEEVERLLDRDLPDSLPVMRAIGVPQIAGYLRGDLSYEQAVEQAQAATRQYAKRQYTWLRHQPPKHWPRLAPENVEIQSIFERLFFD